MSMDNNVAEVGPAVTTIRLRLPSTMRTKSRDKLRRAVNKVDGVDYVQLNDGNLVIQCHLVYYEATMDGLRKRLIAFIEEETRGQFTARLES